MTALGPCGSIASGSSFVVNEVTTAASVWALASFMSGGGNVGASCTNTTGLDNAFTHGQRTRECRHRRVARSRPSLHARRAHHQAEHASQCAGFVHYVCRRHRLLPALQRRDSGSAAPANTLDAALNIARAPANNVAAIYALASANATSSRRLSPPRLLTGCCITPSRAEAWIRPRRSAVDASGNVWASSYFNTVSEFSPAGAATFPAGITGSGINESYGMALDVQGNVWIANEQTTSNSGNGDVTELNSSGQAIASGITSGGIYFPIGVAADPNGNMWFADYGDSKVTLLSSSGSAISSSSGWGGTSLAFPVALAVDAGHNAWVANQGGLLPITEISADGSKRDEL